MIDQKINFQKNIEKCKSRAWLATNGVIQGTSRQKLYDNLSLHSPRKVCWRNELLILRKY